MKRWVHLDSCECARDQHLLYDKGWGKKQSYVLAFSTEGRILISVLMLLIDPISGAQDVSKAYIQDWQAALLRRSRIDEQDLQQFLEDVTTRRRSGLTPEAIAQLREDDKTQRLFVDGNLGHGDEESLQARQSGTAEWKAARGEDGMYI